MRTQGEVAGTTSSHRLFGPDDIYEYLQLYIKIFNYFLNNNINKKQRNKKTCVTIMDCLEDIDEPLRI